MSTTPKESFSPLQKWLVATTRLQDFVKKNLAALSFKCAQRPWLTILISVIFTLVCAVGALRFEVITKSEKLWVDQNSAPMAYRDYGIEAYGDRPVPVRVLFQSNPPGQNALTVGAFREAFEVYDEIYRVNNEGVTFSDICLLGGRGDCYNAGALRFFFSNRTYFEQVVGAASDPDAAVRSAVSATNYPDDGGLVVREDIFGGLQESGGMITVATAFRVDFIIRSEGEESVKLDWQKAALDTYVGDDFLTTQRWNNAHVEIWAAARSVDDELARAISGDIIFMSIAFNFLIISCMLLIGDPLKGVEGRRLLGFMEFWVVIGGTISGYGLAMLFGVPFTSLQQILPFILVGIGVDDAFVIVGAYDRTDRLKSVEERIHDSVLHEGMSVTLTSFTNIIAFLCGISASFPAVKYFCMYAAISVFFLWLYHLTLFCAILALDMRRAAARRPEVLCCIKLGKGQDQEQPASTPTSEPQPSLANRLMVKYAKFLTCHIGVKLAVIVAALAFTGVCLWQAIEKTDTQFRIVLLAPDTSYMREFLDAEERSFGGDSVGLNVEVGLHFKAINYHEASVQATMRQLEDKLLALSIINENMGISSWHRSFTAWAVANKGGTNPWFPTTAFEMAGEPQQEYFTGPQYYEALAYFLRNCSLGCRFKDELKFSGTSAVRDSRVWVRQVSMTRAPDQADALVKATEFNEEIQSIMPGAFASADQYVFYDQFRIIRSELLLTTGMCFVSVFVVSLVIISHPVAVIIVFGVLLQVFADLLGCVPLLGVSLNSISMINMVMAIGLVVDYSMHIAHSFMAQKPQLSRDERAVLAMSEMGVSVAKGVISTFVAILPLAFASSEVFRVFFKMFLAILLVGGSHGLVLMPVVLSLIGPRRLESVPTEAWTTKQVKTSSPEA